MKINNLPNILLITTDQQKASATGIYGNKTVKTSMWGQFAKEGVTFERCFSTSPICAPSRISILTGMYPLTHGVTCNHNDPEHVNKSLRQLPELLNESGYETACIGNGLGDLSGGWDYNIDFYDSAYGLNDIFKQADELSRKVKPLNGWISGVHPVSAKNGVAAKTTDYALQYVEKQRKKPFFLHAAYMEPHPPYFPPEPYASMYNPDEIDLPENPDVLNRPKWQNEAAREMNIDKATEIDIKLAIARYYGLISYADEQIERLLDKLKESGILENTWIIITSDHGDYAGEHGLFAKSEALYDCLLHVPLVIRAPDGALSPGKRIGEMVQLVDIFSTICEIAGVKVPDLCQSYSLIPYMNGLKNVFKRQAVFAAVGGNINKKASFPQGMPVRGIHSDVIKMVRTTNRKYINDESNGHEYYDLDKDPDEIHNIFAGSDNSEIIEMKDLLFSWEENCKKYLINK
ncbi:MAG: hypothetical protein A2231_12700 [Candidatus Firestonebacteria bacterium RIFOXYA2_FULL_40_8]|nr:MAG: hypothetical protein A2231_12700 [Candidatus Firestonebacteria bacterium RIFOXYA2_FULL_40_8]